MYFRLEIVPKFQFLTVAVGADGLPYFLYRDLKNLLNVRNTRETRGPSGETYSAAVLENVVRPAAWRKERIPMRKLKQVLPNEGGTFKYETFHVLSEEDVFRVMNLYVKDMDRELYDWFVGAWSSSSSSGSPSSNPVLLLRPANPKSLAKVLRKPWLAGRLATIPRFVATNHLVSPPCAERLFPTPPEDASFKTWYYPSIVAATLRYFEALTEHPSYGVSTMDEETCDEDSQEPPEEAVATEEEEEGGGTNALELLASAAAAVEDVAMEVEVGGPGNVECEASEQQQQQPQILQQNQQHPQILQQNQQHPQILQNQQPENQSRKAQELSFDEQRRQFAEKPHCSMPQQQQKCPIKITACLVEQHPVGMVSIEKFPDFIVASHGLDTMTYRPVYRKMLGSPR